MGCAIAVIAMVTGAGYQNVMRRAFPNGADRLPGYGRSLDLGITPYQMAKIIKSYGLRARVSHNRRFLKTTSIMLFDWFPPEDYVLGHHAVVWSPHQGKILDPGSYYELLGLDFYINRWIDSGRVAVEIED